ncbi:amidohydrolase family protein [Roseobacter sinensis]|uniref:Amidohydrolase n=1 Tax=Roseobacter sinensis TaxID=2931391 RepID=A0ABT3B9N1_9RHOB|nr:amidohydrolase [Roseobacter sp. WL0113]MCV3269843.1 amidohydrolase [Roseobacter sp. WL0113]
MLFDTHLHLIYKDRLSYPWLGDFDALNRDNPFEAYTRAAARLGISGCFHMEVDVAEAQIEEEIDVIAALSDQADGLLRGIISSCRPEHADFPAFLERVSEQTLLRGFRRVLHVVPDDVSTSALFRDNIKRLSGTGKTFDLCVLPRQLHLAIALVDHAPEVTFILDHCGVPDIATGALEPWRTDLRALAERPNVRAKISGIIAYGDPDRWTLNDLRPFVEETVDAFGHDRLVWGSDSPVCNLGGGLETWVAATHALTAGWSTEDRAAFYKTNAVGIWGL